MTLHIVVGMLFLMFCLCVGGHALTMLDRAQRGMRATFAECDAFDQLLEWRLANPGGYIGDVAYARRLVEVCIQTYVRFLDTHGFNPHAKQHAEYLAFLRSLFDEHGPEPPRKRFPIASLTRGDAFLSSAGLTIYMYARYVLTREHETSYC